MIFRNLLRVVVAVAGLAVGGRAEEKPAFLKGAEASFGRVEAESAAKRGKFSTYSDARAFAAAIGPLDAAIREATSLVVYEGVPRLVKDKAALEVEMGERKTFKVDGQTFFADPKAATSELAATLHAAVFAAAKPGRVGSVKLCGGFHADYLLRWEGKTGRTDALLCFGCHEIKLFGAAGSLYGDLSAEGVKSLRSLLAPFAKERPKQAAMK